MRLGLRLGRLEGEGTELRGTLWAQCRVVGRAIIESGARDKRWLRGAPGATVWRAGVALAAHAALAKAALVPLLGSGTGAGAVVVAQWVLTRR